MVARPAGNRLEGTGHISALASSAALVVAYGASVLILPIIFQKLIKLEKVREGGSGNVPIFFYCGSGSTVF